MAYNLKCVRAPIPVDMVRSFLYTQLLLLLISCTSIHLITATDINSSLCHDDESAALLLFKQSFVIDTSSAEAFAHPKLLSWKLDRSERETSDCCFWDGVECDEVTGHVIGLNLGSSFLYGSINSNSSLFSVVHLQTLDLSDNHFNYSQIPADIANLARLSTLNFSHSVFSGHIPSEFLRLRNLDSLDLSSNVDPSSNQNLVNLEKPSLKSLVESLTNLKFLYLNEVTISSTVPDTLAKMSSLKALGLRDCGLFGKFPESIFLLPNLQHLDLQSYGNLTGQLPEFHNSSYPLRALRLANTGFSGRIPFSFGNLKSMKKLDLSECNFSGPIPPSFGNLTKLSFLSLSFNTFNEGKLSWLGKLTKLASLDLIKTNLQGEIPSSLSNSTQLSVLRLRFNNLVGQIPSWLMNQTQLTFLDLADNQLQGPIPSSLSLLYNLDTVDLSTNSLSGAVDIDVYLSLRKLTRFGLSRNRISLLISHNTTNSTSLPKFECLELIGCNLGRFPDFLRFQDKLEVLFQGSNSIGGLIPIWMWNISVETLGTMALENNLLTGFEQNLGVLPGAAIRISDLSRNLLQGSLPVPPTPKHIHL